MSVISEDSKTAIVLFNLGGPDKPEAVKPFLFNLFNDPAIIGAPNPIRFLLAKFISSKREKTAQEIYEFIGGKSPIMEETEKQRKALQKSLAKTGDNQVFICMRYWHPMSEQVVAEVKAYNPDHIILLPLYPQFSTTTSGSSLKDWKEEAEKQGLDIPTTEICCYPTEPHFISSHVRKIREHFLQASAETPARILFSAHGLPEKIIDAGDPYQWQVEQTTKAIVDILGIPELDYVNCYQSRVGPLKWIGPSTEDEIMRAGADKKPIVLVPIAFVSEHSETLVELDIEYREIADEHGVPIYSRVPALTDDADYIECLSQLCLSVKPEDTLMSQSKQRVCPKQCKQCPCKEAA